MVVTKAIARDSHYLRLSGERSNANEFPGTPSVCHDTPSGSTSAFWETSPIEERSPERSYIICTPIQAGPAWDAGQEATEQSVSFEVRQFDDIKEAIPEWDDDDVDELILLAPRRKPRVLSTIVESPKGPKPIRSSDFEVICPLQRTGSPGLGELVLGRKKDTSTLYAIKVFRRTNPDSSSHVLTYAQTEQAALRYATEHQVPFVVKLCWSFHDEKALYIVLINRCEENLRMRVERSGVLHPGNAKMCAAEMVYALTALHAIGIVHRDLKPESVLIQPDGHIVLTDFGYAQIVPIGKQDVAVDKHAPSAPAKGIYRAPEVIMGWAHDAAVDWWGFGLILCFMLTGSHPFLATDDSASLHETISESKILHGKLIPCLPEMISSEALDLITQCLERNPALRLSDEAVKQHSFFATVQWNAAQSDETSDSKCEVIGEHLKPNQSLFSDLGPPGITQGLLPAALSGSSKDCSVIDGFSFNLEGQYTGNVAQTVSGAHVVNEEPVENRVSLGLTRRSILTQDAPSPDDDDHGDESVIPAEFGGYQYGVEGPKRFGTLRKFSSLDFDTDTLESAPSSRQMNSLATNPPVSHQLRKSRSSYMSPFMQSQSTAGLRNKLRKKTRPESATIPAYVQRAMLDLPPGIEQIGNGIGYVRRSKPIHARLSFATLTPRSCHGMFSGTRFPRLAPRHERKKNGNGNYFEHAGSGVSVLGGTRDSEDQMDAVMREMYGSRWNLGTSASELSLAGGADPRVYTTLTRTAVGLGLGATELDVTRARLPTAPTELSTLSPDSTLRLVSPSTLHLVYC